MLVSPGTPAQIPDPDWITRWVGRLRVGDRSTGAAVTDEKGGKAFLSVFFGLGMGDSDPGELKTLDNN
jgi:hypothetical protein